ncbi:MAG: hypothetical protein ABF959_00240 [Gluconobacter albidus]
MPQRASNIWRGDLYSGGKRSDAAASAWQEEMTPVSMRRRRFDGAGRPQSSPLSDRASTAPNGLFNGLIWPKGGCASIA